MPFSGGPDRRRKGITLHGRAWKPATLIQRFYRLGGKKKITRDVRLKTASVQFCLLAVFQYVLNKGGACQVHEIGPN